MTNEEKEFLLKLYGEAYKTAMEKLKKIEELGNKAYDQNGNLLPEFNFSFKEKAVINGIMNLKEEEKGKSL